MSTKPKARKRCRVPGCLRPQDVLKHELCRPHYKRWIRTGQTGGAKIRKKQWHRPYPASA